MLKIYIYLKKKPKASFYNKNHSNSLFNSNSLIKNNNFSNKFQNTLLKFSFKKIIKFLKKLGKEHFQPSFKDLESILLIKKHLPLKK